MTVPNINNSLQLHAYAKVSAATPPIVTDPVNISGVTRTGAGIWVATLGSEIDDTQRMVVLTGVLATHTTMVKDPAVQTDSTIGVLAFALAVAADTAFEILVYRIASPS